MDIEVFSGGVLRFNGKEYSCTLGGAGIVSAQDKKEGDSATPAGSYPLRRVFYRADKIGAAPVTALPTVVIERDDGWCDDPAHPDYNRLVKKPFTASHEDMWRQDSLYDVVVEVGYNDSPPVPGKGSAIFMHYSSPSGGSTAGCVGLKPADLHEVLVGCGSETRINISPKAI